MTYMYKVYCFLFNISSVSFSDRFFFIYMDDEWDAIDDILWFLTFDILWFLTFSLETVKMIKQNQWMRDIKEVCTRYFCFSLS